MWEQFEPEWEWKDILALLISIVAFVIYAGCIVGLMYIAVHFIVKYW